MGNLKISQLPQSTTLTGIEEIALVQSTTTKKATIDQIKTYVQGTGYDTLVPTIESVQNGDTLNLGDVGYENIGFIQLKWVGGNGNQNMDIILPPVIGNSNRVFRFTTNGSFTSNTHARVKPVGVETIDGTSEYVINIAYEGVQVWCDGVEWIVIQAKSH